MNTSEKTRGGGPVIVNQRDAMEHRCPKRASRGEVSSIFNFRLSTADCQRASHSSSPALRNFASKVFGDTPNFSEARVLFHLHSRKVLSSRTRSMWPTARPVTSSNVPSQLNCSGSIPAGNWPVSGFVAGSWSPSAVMLRPSVRITARSMVFCSSRTFPGQR